MSSSAIPDGTCDVLIPRDRYDPFAIVAMVERWNTESEPVTPETPTTQVVPAHLWARVAITEPGGSTVEVDTP